MNSKHARILRTLTLTLFCLLLGPKAARAYEMFGHAGWNIGANTSQPVYGFPGAGSYREDPNNLHMLYSVHQGKYGLVYVNKATGKCLIMHGEHNGAPVGHWDCEPTDPKMNWRAREVGGGAWLFQNTKFGGQCIDAPVRAHNGLVHGYRCDPHNENQKFWRLGVHHSQDPAPWLPKVIATTNWSQLSLWNGYSLNTNHSSRFASQHGPVIGLRDGDLSDGDQDFRFEKLDNGSYLLRQGSLNKCLDSTSGYHQGANPIAHPCNPGNSNQHWEKLNRTNGSFLLRRKGSNLCLDSSGGDRNGQWTHLWTCEGWNKNQQFRFGDVNKLDAFYDYEVWLVARKRPSWIPVDLRPGHAFVGLVGRRRDNGHWAPGTHLFLLA